MFPFTLILLRITPVDLITRFSYSVILSSVPYRPGSEITVKLFLALSRVLIASALVIIDPGLNSPFG